MNSHKQSGFSFIEALFSVMVFSVFLLVIWQLQHNTFKHLSKVLEVNLLQFELNQMGEKILAYPLLDLRGDSGNLINKVTVFNYDTYTEIFLCSESGKESCLSLVTAKPNLDFLSSKCF